MGRKVASRAEVAPFHVMEVVRAAREREEATGDVLHLEVGQPSTGAPASAIAAAHAALGTPESLGYTDADGMPALRQAIADRYRAAGVEVAPVQVAVTAGASVACVLAFLAAFAPGDRVALCEPGYPCYRQMLHALGVEPVPIRIGPDSRFQPTPELLDAALPLDGLVVASPSNPTGSVLTLGELADLAAWCDRHDVRLVSDEIYHGITYGPPAPTAAAHADVRPIVVNSFSKYFSMTGWRLGWLVLPEELIRPVELLAQNLFISAPTLSQVAAIAALDDAAELDAHVTRYATNRELVLDGLARLGCTTVAPAEGAFYCYADVSHLGADSQDLCRRWLADVGVAATPGIDFDPVDGHRFVRFSFAGPTDGVREAMVRLAAWAKR